MARKLVKLPVPEKPPEKPKAAARPEPVRITTEARIETTDANRQTTEARAFAKAGVPEITFVGITAKHLAWLLSELPEYELAVPLGLSNCATLRRRT